MVTVVAMSQHLSLVCCVWLSEIWRATTFTLLHDLDKVPSSWPQDIESVREHTCGRIRARTRTSTRADASMHVFVRARSAPNNYYLNS